MSMGFVSLPACGFYPMLKLGTKPLYIHRNKKTQNEQYWKGPPGLPFPHISAHLASTEREHRSGNLPHPAGTAVSFPADGGGAACPCAMKPSILLQEVFSNLNCNPQIQVTLTAASTPPAGSHMLTSLGKRLPSSSTTTGLNRSCQAGYGQS